MALIDILCRYNDNGTPHNSDFDPLPRLDFNFQEFADAMLLLSNSLETRDSIITKMGLSSTDIGSQLSDVDELDNLIARATDYQGGGNAESKRLRRNEFNQFAVAVFNMQNAGQWVGGVAGGIALITPNDVRTALGIATAVYT
jgi:hypothetical protein